MTKDERLAAFEAMLTQVQADMDREKALMDDLKARGREKSATYRQYLGNRLVYTQMLARYKAHGLVE